MTESVVNQHRDPFWVSVVHWPLIAFGVVAPWALHFAVGWWAAIIAIVAFVLAYDLLFVPRGSICMGIPFMLPFGTSILLLLVQCVSLLKWCVIRFGGG